MAHHQTLFPLPDIQLDNTSCYMKSKPHMRERNTEKTVAEHKN